MYNIRCILSDPVKRRRWVANHHSSLKAWLGFCLAVVVIFFFLSDGDYSFMLTLSSFIGTFSFVMVAFCVERGKSSRGISVKMFDCYLVLLFFRLLSIIFFDGYLPYDRTGDWFYQTSEACSFLFCAAVGFLCRVRYRSTYDSASDSLNPLLLIVPCFLLSLAIHPSLNSFMPADTAWTFALYLEATACLPQLFMFQKQQKVEPFMTHFLAGQALSKVVCFLFWISCYTELNDTTKSLKSYVGVWVIVLQVIQLVVMGDFIHQYIRCISRGVPVEFILTENV